MKEERYFYVPEAATSQELPPEEAQHAVRVLRLATGDVVYLMDGQGTFYRAAITEADRKRCLYRIEEKMPQDRSWQGRIHLAMAPTKNMDRNEWFAEKATEIGFDELSFLRCQFSERTVVKTDRVDKILVSAMKQSHKAWKPVLNEMEPFSDFISRDFGTCDKFICHCYGEESGFPETEKPLLKEALTAGHDVLVMVGPEGDFSVDEVKAALRAGFHSVSLGKSRLRTETAALVAVHLMHLANE